MRSTFRILVLSAASLLFAAPSQAEARQPYRLYTPPRPAYRGVYVYPQIVTTPAYTAPWYYYSSPSYSLYTPGFFGGYVYTPGSYVYNTSPVWGTSYYYTNPAVTYWRWWR